MSAPSSVDVITQIGVETTRGTGVAALTRVPTLSFTPQSNIGSEQFTAQGYKNSTSSVIHKLWSQGGFEGPLDFNSFTYILSSLVGATSASPTTPGGGTLSRQWDFSPKATGADSNAKTFTVERGVPALGMQKMTYCKLTSLNITSTQDSLKVAGNLLAQFPTDANAVSGDEIQAVTITGTPTGGTFTLTYSGQTTAGIAFDATAAVVQAALEALSNIVPGDVICAGGPLPGTAVTVQFTANLGAQNVALMTASAASLTGGTTPAVTVTTTTAGATVTSIAERPVARGMVNVYIDSTNGGIGTTKITDVYDENLQIGDKDVPFWVHNTDYASFKELVEQPHAVTFTFKTAHNAQSQAQFAAISANPQRYIQWVATGAIIEGTIHEKITLPFTGKFTQAQPMYSDGGVYGYSYQFAGTFDSSFNGVWSAQVVNAITAL